jgi:hypothetical protein
MSLLLKFPAMSLRIDRNKQVEFFHVAAVVFWVLKD